jgi:hypothetical protein
MTRSIVGLVVTPGLTGGGMDHLQQPDTLMWEAVGDLQAIESKKDRARPTHKRHKSWQRVDSLADLALPLSLGETLERMTAESFMLVGLAFKLFSYLGLGMWANSRSTDSTCIAKSANVWTCCRLEVAVHAVQARPVCNIPTARVHTGTPSCQV